MKNIFVPQNNCGQENNKMGKNLFYLENSRFVLINLKPVENSAECLCEGFGPAISQQSHKVYN